MNDALASAFESHRAGRLSDAEQLYLRCLKVDPGNWEALHGLGVICLQQSRFGEARSHLEAVIRSAPGFAPVYNSLAVCLLAAKETGAALKALDRAVELDPGFGDVWVNRGLALRNLGQHRQAAESYGRAIAILGPQFALLVGRGECLLAIGLLHLAVEDANSALVVKPDSAEALNLRGRALLRLGQAAEAVADFERSLLIRPGYFEAAVHKGIALRDLGRVSEACEWLAKVEAAYPAALEPRYNRALAEQDRGRYSAACGALSGVLAQRPDFAPGWIALGSVQLEMGKPDEAAAAYRQAFRLEPWNIQALSGALLCQAYLPNVGGSEQLDPTAAARVLLASGEVAPDKRCSTRPRRERLRIGFVSGDFREHVTVNFLEKVLQWLDRSRFELHAFSCLNFEDGTTRRLRSIFDGWCILAADNGAARRQVDQVVPDILVDLSGHTAHNRLPLFAPRLAPLQVTWLGYWATTGLPEIDYILVDPYAWRTEDNEFFAETPWPLPETRLCFSPPSEAPDICPNFGDGRQIVFGAFGNPSKLNARVIAVWGKILRAAPGSRLWLKARAYADDEVRAGLIKAFEGVGIEPLQLIVEPYAPRESYLANYNRVDLVLDTFPFPGGTTTAEALWMGVPVLTLAGTSLIARQGESMLINAGLDDWIAHSEDDYVAKALGYVQAFERRRDSRVGVRERLRSTPLFDSKRFAAHLGDAFEKMWAVATTSRP